MSQALDLPKKKDYNGLEYACLRFGSVVLAFHKSYDLAIDEWKDLMERAVAYPYKPMERELRDLRAEQRRAERMAYLLSLKPARALHRDLRQLVIKRDKSTCRYCGIVLEDKGRQLHLDHVIAHSKGGQTTMENMVVSCGPCNSRKRDRTLEEAGMTLLAIS